ncbi:hypothetical protein KO02_11660 [Sphingobacterium sp. ML3W]|uniref:alpha/beta fold hydrolase n=1 Tax=Sphingobacterium sp. ML3W TaxID=1538644 RepID=UPI0004F5CE27|nr:alpha/beta hydrolase [Sphingobacterium sp. ML3W]AIM37273.1 hypothetical protein KO02_11660 [Sphingobacterium sp. ML3W]
MKDHYSSVPNYRTVLTMLILISASYLDVFSQEIADQRIMHDYQSALKDYESYEQNHRKDMQVKNVRLSYLEWGNLDNKDKVLIWLHGSLSNAYEFYPYADSIVKSGYRVISIDQYNAGKTPLPNFDASFDDLSIDIKCLMDSLGIEKAVIGGFSRGAFLATHIYKTMPQYVSALILEDGGSVAFATSYLKLDEESLKRKLKDVDLPAEVVDKYSGYFSHKFDAYKSLYDADINTNQFEILSYLKPQNNQWITYRGQFEYNHMQDSLHMAEVIFHKPNVSKYAKSIVEVKPTDIFKDLATPVLIMDANAEQDPIPVRIENRELAMKHPQFIKLVVFEDVAHNIHYTYPSRFLHEVISFLDHQVKD